MMVKKTRVVSMFGGWRGEKKWFVKDRSYTFFRWDVPSTLDANRPCIIHESFLCPIFSDSWLKILHTIIIWFIIMILIIIKLKDIND